MPSHYRRKTNPTPQDLRNKWLGAVHGPDGLSEDVVNARIARARDAAERGLNMAKWAAEEGTSGAAVSIFLARPDVPEDVADALRRNNHAGAQPAAYYYWMLKCMVMADAGLWTAASAAERLGVHPSIFPNIRKRKCPDGNLREALELLGYEVFGDDQVAEDDVRLFYTQVRIAARCFVRSPIDRRRHTGLDRFRRVGLVTAEATRKDKARRFLEMNLA